MQAQNGEYPLHCAAQYGHGEVLLTLLQVRHANDDPHQSRN